MPFGRRNLPPFPIEALPSWLREFVEAEAIATQTPADVAGAIGLAVVATCVAKIVVVRVRDGHVEPVNVFWVVALPPANRKSTVFADMAAPLEVREAFEAREREPDIVEAENRRKILQLTLDQKQKAAATATPADRGAASNEASDLSRELSALIVPVRPRYLADDCSQEKLATLLQDNGGRMGILSAEGELFELMAGRYSKNGAPNLGVYLKAHSGDTLRIDRIGRPPEFIERPALTIGLTVQPEVIRSLADKPGFRGRGLLARFLYSMPESLVGRRVIDPPTVPAAVRAAYHRNVDALLDLPFGNDDAGKPAPHVLTLDNEAQAVRREFEIAIEPTLAAFAYFDAIPDWGGKLVGAVIRIGGLLHVAEHGEHGAPWEVPMSAATMRNAIAIGRYLGPHAHAAFATMGADGTVEDAKYLLDAIERRHVLTFTKRDLFQWTRSRFDRVSKLEPALQLLVEHLFVRQRAVDVVTGPGRRPSPTFEVNPLWYAQIDHNAHNPDEPGDSEQSEESE
ncbi:MAG: DUF3987 domain-containing protein [Planctomycetes bacterium]|nr:DUF3987 domain-containing protein [Planctomycetota bacterium]